MKKILLLGEGGYIGNSFKEYMSKFPNYQIDTVSSMNREWTKMSFAEYDVVYNVSGLAHSNARQASEDLYYEVNGRLPVEMANKAKVESVPLFIHMSSMIIYGNMSKLGRKKIIGSDTIAEPDGVYGKSKIMAEEGLMLLEDSNFRIAIIRPPLIYGEHARDNFPRLVKFALTSPIFPDVYNEQSMIYVDNLCELIRLIIENKTGGIYFPQEPEYIHTSNLVKDISQAAGKRMLVTKIFNPILRLASGKIRFVRKAFGSLIYDQELSRHFDWKYCVVPYEETVRRIAEKYRGEGR